MPTIYTGKKKLIETPKQQQQKPQNQTADVEALKKQIADAQIPNPADRVGGGMAANQIQSLYPETGQIITQGRLKPEFQQMEDAAAKIESTGSVQLPAEEQIRNFAKIQPGQSSGKTYFPKATQAIENARITGGPGQPTFLQVLQAELTAIPGIKQLKGLIDNSNLDKLNRLGDDIVTGIQDGSLTPSQVDDAFNVYKTKLAETQQYLKLSSNFDWPAKISGQTPQAMLDLSHSYSKLLSAERLAANALRTNMANQISSQTRTYRPGVGGR